jgi:glycine/D-amino acid oxidase-like deaminating enzyme
VAEITADAVVVGAGVIGSSIALELARAGRDVIVVDRAAGPGQGSTAASSAIIRFNYSTWDGVALSWEAKHCWADWRAHLGAGPDEPLARFHRVGLVMLDAPPVPRERYRPLFDAAGIPYEEWDASTLRARLPMLDPGRFWPPRAVTDEAFWADSAETLGALFTPDAGFVDDPQLAAINLADAARRHGARFQFAADVAGVPRDGARVAGVTLTDGRRIRARVVVNAAGPWSSMFNRLAGIPDDFTIRTRPMRQEVHHLPAPPAFTVGERGTVVADLDLGTYVRAAPGDAMLVGGTEPECDDLQWLDDPDQANPNPTLAVYEAQTTRAARRFPDLRVAGQPRGIAGVYDVADDWTPIYDRTALPGYYVAIGTSGNQFKNAPVAGRLMATLVTACESGHPHDDDAVVYVGPHTGHSIDLGSFSRKRAPLADTSRSVMG